MDESGKWLARASGAQSLAFIVYGPYYGGLSKDALVKVFLPMNIVAFLLMLQGAFSKASIYSKSSFAKYSLWKLILPAAAAGAVLRPHDDEEGRVGAPSIPPGWGIGR